MSILKFSDKIVSIDDYEVDKYLGGGQYGEVFRGKKKDSTTRCAIKKIKTRRGFGYIDAYYFMREVTSLYLNHHPCLLSLRGFSLPKSNVGPNIVTSLSSHNSLSNEFKKKKSEIKTDTRRMILTLGIVAGVAHLHGMNTLHRDIKPGNILLNINYEPILADFGYARGKVSRADPPSGNQFGTDFYLSPEARDIRHKPTFKDDVYSMGLVLHQVLTSQKPDKKQEREPIANEKLNDLVEQLLNFDPNERPGAYTVFILLKKKCYWLKDTNKETYMAYYNKLEKATNPEITERYRAMKKAADLGDPIEQYNIYKEISKLDNEISKVISIEYLKKSADKEFPPACYELALIKYSKNKVKALSLLEKAAKKHYRPAIAKLEELKNDSQ